MAGAIIIGGELQNFHKFRNIGQEVKKKVIPLRMLVNYLSKVKRCYSIFLVTQLFLKDKNWKKIIKYKSKISSLRKNSDVEV